MAFASTFNICSLIIAIYNIILTVLWTYFVQHLTALTEAEVLETVKPHLIISGKCHVCVNIHVSVHQRYDSAHFI
jgi:hypothetical protein